MRRVSANYIIPVSSPPLKNGIIEFDDSGRISSLIDTGGNLKESANLEFYNGLLVPGFINPYCRIEPFIIDIPRKDPHQPEFSIDTEYSEVRDDLGIHSRFRELERILKNSGICGLGSVSSNHHFFSNKSAGKLKYHSFIEVCQQKGADSFEIFNHAVEVIMTGWNEYNLMCSLIPFDSCSDKEIATLVAEFTVTHYNPVILKCQDKSVSSESLLIDFSESLARITGKSADAALNSFNSPIIFPVTDLSGFILELKSDIFYLLSIEDFQRTGLMTLSKDILKKISNHILFSSYGSGFHTHYPIISELIILQSKIPSLSINELLRSCTINPARALKMDKYLGSLEPGKAPGINLITNIDFSEMKLTEKSELKALI
ncbi:MAG: hypothetical protein AMS27_02200 [Bacteroides sp. SM23_62_1]|nr:MAG: hypothetical protein AMS27_02200 [Bacteroides sp. SM23_62_1]